MSIKIDFCLRAFEENFTRLSLTLWGRFFFIFSILLCDSAWMSVVLSVFIYGSCEGNKTVWAVVSKSPPPAAPLIVDLLCRLLFIRCFENSSSLDTEEKNYLELFLKVRPVAASTRLLALSMSIYCWLSEFVGELLKVSNWVWFGELLAPKFVKFN